MLTVIKGRKYLVVRIFGLIFVLSFTVKTDSMQIEDAKKLTLNLMSRHGLSDWEFKFHNAKRIFGTCYHTRKVIALSKELVQINDVERVTNTVLHEIAHALVGRGHGHDYVWKRKALEIGCNGQRCFTENDTVTVKYAVEAECKTCGKIFGFHRMPKVRRCCGICSSKFDEKQVLVFEKKR
jgi:predicted SprT family Zn-dependent metalloprotease